jgi:hypothetical protein
MLSEFQKQTLVVEARFLKLSGRLALLKDDGARTIREVTMRRTALLGALLLSACDDSIPGLCNVDSDCSSNICYRGVCIAPEDDARSADDAGSADAAGATDDAGSTDASSTSDAASSDADSASDAGSRDAAGSTDAGRT